MAETKYNITLKAKDKTAKEFQKLNRNIDNTQKAMKKIAGAFAGAFAVRQLVQFGQAALDTADAIGKVADSAGVSAEFLQKYQFAAQQSGLTTEEFNKGLQNFTKMVGQATIRTSEAGRSLEKLGVRTKNTDGSIRTTEQVFIDLFSALDNVGSQFEKNAVLADLMGRAGVKLAVMAKDGASSMKALAESATGVFTDEQVDNAERFNDVMNRLTRQVLVPMQGHFINFTNSVLDISEALGFTIKEQKTVAQLEALLIKQKKELNTLDTLKTKNTVSEQQANKLFVQIQLTERNIKLLKEQQKFYENQEKISLAQNDAISGQVKVFQTLENTVSGKLTTSFKNFFDFTKREFLDFGNLTKSILSEVVNELIRVFLVQNLVKGITSLISAATPTPESNTGIDFTAGKLEGMGGLTMEGGGFTGFGSRTGGVDGRGGFPAILHPNETVIDHTKGQGMGATVNFNITTVDAASFDNLLASRKGLITSIINNAMNTKGKMGVV